MSSEFLKRTMVPNVSTKVETGNMISGKRINPETLSPFDRTVYKGTLRPGQHPRVEQHKPEEESAFSLHQSTLKPSPREFLRRGQGLGGTANIAAAREAELRKVEAAKAVAPPKAHAMDKRPNPPNSELRRYYERSDLPCIIVQGAKNKLSWKVDLMALDYHHYLPLFASGLREEEEPYRFLGEEGTLDLIHAGGEAKVLPVVPQLILPLKDAIATRDHKIIVRTLRVISALAGLGPRVGAALVPYYRQLLPVLNVFLGRGKNLGDGIEYSQRFGSITSVLTDTLNKLEVNGGPDALINLKYCLPAYESALMTA